MARSGTGGTRPDADNRTRIPGPDDHAGPGRTGRPGVGRQGPTPGHRAPEVDPCPRDRGASRPHSLGGTWGGTTTPMRLDRRRPAELYCVVGWSDHTTALVTSWGKWRNSSAPPMNNRRCDQQDRAPSCRAARRGDPFPGAAPTGRAVDPRPAEASTIDPPRTTTAGRRGDAYRGRRSRNGASRRLPRRGRPARRGRDVGSPACESEPTSIRPTR